MSDPRPSITEVVESLARELHDRPWTERYRLLVKLGDTLVPLQDHERSEENLVPGCLSRVWLVADDDGTGGTPTFRGDSDSRIVRGLIAVAFRIYAGRTPVELSAHDPAKTFERLDLQAHVTRNRRDGFRAMLLRMQALAGR